MSAGRGIELVALNENVARVALRENVTTSNVASRSSVYWMIRFGSSRTCCKKELMFFASAQCTEVRLSHKLNAIFFIASTNKIL